MNNVFFFNFFIEVLTLAELKIEYMRSVNIIVQIILWELKLNLSLKLPV